MERLWGLVVRDAMPLLSHLCFYPCEGRTIHGLGTLSGARGPSVPVPELPQNALLPSVNQEQCGPQFPIYLLVSGKSSKCIYSDIWQTEMNGG